jgi:arylsulfatase A-like enzyme
MTRSACAFLLFLGVSALAACSEPHGEKLGKGVLVIAIDSLRVDHVSAYGYDRPTTPTIDHLARQGTTFSSAYTTSPEVMPAHATLLTGCDPKIAFREPSGAGLQGPLLTRWYIPDAVPRLAQELLANGFVTGAFVDHPWLAPVRGFGAGFQEFHEARFETSPEAEIYRFDEVAARFLRWLSGHDANRDWFAYVHFNDLERVWRLTTPDATGDTYFAPRPELSAVPPVAEADRVFFAVPQSRWAGGTRSMGEYEARYDGSIRQLDNRLERLFIQLGRTGRLENTTVVIVGTYGMGFGETGLVLDSGTLSDADLHVPLIVRPAPRLGLARGGMTNALTSLMDLAPTLLEMEGIEKPRGMHGVSQYGALNGSTTPARELVFASGGLQRGFCVIDSRWCYEWSLVGMAQPQPLARSWFGDDLDHSADFRSLLHDREHDPSKGHLTATVADREVASRLHTAGFDWYTWIERARDVLQGGALVPKTDLETMAELRRRGLLGDEVPNAR